MLEFLAAVVLVPLLAQAGPTVELPPGADEVPAVSQPGTAVAAPAAAPAPAPEPKKIVVPDRPQPRLLTERADEGVPGMGTVAFWTFFVLALMAGLFVILKRYARKTKYLGAGVIQILARKPLSQRHEVFLVEAGPKVFLVGATKEALVTLGEFAGAGEVASLRTQSPARNEDSIERSFRKSLAEGLRENEAPPRAREPVGDLLGELKDIRRTVMSWKA